MLLDGGEREYFGVSPGRMRDALEKDFPSDIEAISRIYNDNHPFRHRGNSFSEEVSYVDPSFFDIFDLDVIAGNREAIFADNQSILITASIARKYFGDEDPIGQILEPGDEDFAFRIVGVIADLPENTHLDIDFIALFTPERYLTSRWVATYWHASNVYTYIKLSSQSRADILESEIPAFLDRNVDLADAPGVVGRFSDQEKFRLTAVSDIHLKSTGRFQMKPSGDIKLVISFGLIAALILFIACVNFINLATARASLRMREIALRKVVGARRSQLIGQFLFETVITVGVALLMALAIVELALPYFSAFIEKVLSLNLSTDPIALLMVVGLLAVVALGSGLHPAISISRVKPGPVLHTSEAARHSTSRLRSALVTIQFAISIGLIIITFIVASQTAYTQHKDLGFKTKDRMVLSGLRYREVRPLADTIKNEVEALPGVEATSYSFRPLPLSGQWGLSFQKIGDPDRTSYILEDVHFDYEFLEFIEAKLIAGRLFDRNRELDKTHQSTNDPGITEVPKILNRRAAEYLGYDSPEAAIGQSFMYDGPGGRTRVTIIGVVENMHMRSLRDAVEPMGFFIPNDAFDHLNIKILPGQEAETRHQISQIWQKHVSNFPLNLESLEEQYYALYIADQQRGEIFAGFAFFAIFVSAIGLFSQAAFTTQNRTREIGLRKVMGASKRSIVTLMVWQFSKPVLTANLIAWPSAWYLASDWLSGFAYRIDLTPLPFVSASLLALLIAGVTVSVHALKVSSANPINALRHE
jgi:putative ABC transport system permease protein